MSVRVLAIPEDPTLDQFVLKPVLELLCQAAGLARARVEVLRDPHLRGVEQALDPQVVGGIVQDNPMIDLFVLMVDRDCDRAGNVAKAAARVGEHEGKLLACLAREEVEVWLLAVHRDELGTPWQEVRAECDPKERYADPFLRGKGWHTEVGHGRKRAMRDLGARWAGVLAVCDELRELRDALVAWKAAHEAG